MTLTAKLFRTLAAHLVVGLLLAGLALTPATAGAAELPPTIAAELEAAVARGAADNGPADQRRALTQRRLEAAVVSAIATRPDLAGPIVQEAVRLAPEARRQLAARVATHFPAFAPTIYENAGVEAHAAPTVAPLVGTLPQSATTSMFEGIPPPAERPAHWPVLPREGGADGYDDPLEGLNRVFFYTNGALDFLIFEPLAKAYGFIMPDAVKPALGRAFTNLSSPVVFANDLLQLEFQRAGTTLGRFVINSTFGVAGLFDVAETLGLEGHTADFGQTLYHYGVGDGFYLVLPLFGPTTVRDAVGFGVDSVLDPRAYLLEGIPRYGLAVGEGIVRREEVIDPVDFLAEYALDPYDAVRAWTYQQRQRELTGGCTEPIYVVCPAPR